MPLSFYSSLINNSIPLFAHSDEAAELKNPYHILTERHLQAIWLEQKYFKSLTINGTIIEVLSPGIWNSEAGPDFLKAHIRIGDQEWRGDIELHLSQESWYSHHHHTDANYNQVILHLCYWKPLKEKIAITSQGTLLPTAYIQPALTIPESRILKLIDLDLYPYKHFSGSGNCSRTLFNDLSLEKITNLLRSAAVWRLENKMKRLQAKIKDRKDYLMGGIAMVLGYKHNAEIFLEIFKRLNSYRNYDEHILLALALGFCGLYNSPSTKKWSESAYYQQLSNAFSSLNLESFYHLKLDKVRPANHPVRRFAALIKMIKDPYFQNIESKFLTLWQSHWQVCKARDWKKLLQKFIELTPTYHDSYWQHHYTFEKTPQPQAIALIGNDLKKEILINIYLPILYSDIQNRGNQIEEVAFIYLFSSIPATKTKKSIYLHHRFFGNHKKLLLSSAELQQGAYQIHRDFCIHFEASCQGCPFVDRYKKAFG